MLYYNNIYKKYKLKFKYNIQLYKLNETMGIIIEIKNISKQNKQLKG